MNISDKMKSRRWWVVLWSMLYLTVMSVILVITGYDGAWVAGTMAVISGIIGAWMTVSSMKKKAGE